MCHRCALCLFVCVHSGAGRVVAARRRRDCAVLRSALRVPLSLCVCAVTAPLAQRSLHTTAAPAHTHSAGQREHRDATNWLHAQWGWTTRQTATARRIGMAHDPHTALHCTALHTRTHTHTHTTHLLHLSCMFLPLIATQHSTTQTHCIVVRIMNAVHADSNWRQRLRAEQASAGQWREQWGFLEVRTMNNHTSRYSVRQVSTRSSLLLTALPLVSVSHL